MPAKGKLNSSEGGVSTSARESLTKFVGISGKKAGALSKKPGIFEKIARHSELFPRRFKKKARNFEQKG
jgi:hypothetical protein